MLTLIKRICLVVMMTVFVATAFAVENPNVRSRSSSSSRGSATQVPSANQSGTTPNPIGQGTGLSRDSRSTESYIRRPADTFVRRSDSPVFDSISSGRYKTFEDTRRNVPVLSQGIRQDTNLPPAFSKRMPSLFAPQDLPQLKQTQYYVKTPLSLNQTQLQQILSTKSNLMLKPGEDPLAQIDPELFLKRRLIPEEEIEEKAKYSPQELAEIQKQMLPPEDAVPLKKRPELEILEAFREEFGLTDFLKSEQPKIAEEQPETAEGEPVVEKPSRAQLAAEAAAIRGEYKDYASLAQAKYNEYLTVARDFIKQGQFYRAAETYSLALIWVPNDPRAMAGRSFSLFSAGEYMTSSYMLNRAIAGNPQLAKVKVNLPGWIGDRDVYENRIIEMTEWHDKSKAWELSFLMAYVYYSDDKLEKAKDAIDFAYERIPDNTAVIALKERIDTAISETGASGN